MPPKPSPSSAIAARFVDARLGAAAVEQFPGKQPADLDAAYKIQAAAIGMWPDEIGGWKIGLVPPQHRAAFGADRIAGPIFKSQIQRAEGPVDVAVIDGGFAAAEAEFIIALGRDAPTDVRSWSADEAAEFAGALHIGIEIAGSPFAQINDHGPAVTAADFGNNAGLVLGPAIKDWRKRPLDTLTTTMVIDGERVGEGSAALIPGGPMAALAFIIEHCAQQGRKLGKGQLISTGATTGVHQIEAGQTVRATFGDDGVIECRAVPATPRLARKQS